LPSTTEKKISAHKRECTCLAFNSFGDAIVTGGGDNLVKIWSTSNGKEQNELRGFNKPITDVVFSLDNQFLAASSTEHKTTLFKLQTMRSVHTYQGHKDMITSS
jgi:WD40 repeat protein